MRSGSARRDSRGRRAASAGRSAPAVDAGPAISKITMFVCTAETLGCPGIAARPSARIARVGMILAETRRHLFERDQSRGGQNAGLPHSAAQPLAVRAGPFDQLLRARRASTPPARPALSTGRTSPCRRARRSRAPGTPRHAAALKTRAPSMWTLSPQLVRAVADLARCTRSGYTVPPAMLCVFSISIRPVGAQCGPSGRISRADLVPARMPSSVGDRRDHAAGEPRHHRQLVIRGCGRANRRSLPGRARCGA